MIKTILNVCIVIILLSTSCKNEQVKPKVSYETTNQAKTKIAIADTSKITIADLPVQFAGTKFLLFPVGTLRVGYAEKRDYKIENDNTSSFKISNSNDNEITGFLTNVKFQQVDRDTITDLTNKKLLIQSITYLKEFASKTKQHILVYELKDDDTNRDGTIDTNDINTLYISTISGARFTKMTKDFEELLDWQFNLSTNKIFFRTATDTNKNGRFDQGDKIKYYYVELTDVKWNVNEYQIN